jgi:hypothetical protein
MRMRPISSLDILGRLQTSASFSIVEIRRWNDGTIDSGLRFLYDDR